MKPVDQVPYMIAMQAIMDALQYPVAKDGSVMGISDGLNFMKPTLAYHLARCGIGPANPPLIKRQAVTGPGVIEDAVRWVSADAPDDPLEHVEDMTMAQINALPEELRVEAKRRLGILPPYEPPEGWHTHTRINIEGDLENQER